MSASRKILSVNSNFSNISKTDKKPKKKSKSSLVLTALATLLATTIEATAKANQEDIGNIGNDGDKLCKLPDANIDATKTGSISELLEQDAKLEVASLNSEKIGIFEQIEASDYESATSQIAALFDTIQSDTKQTAPLEANVETSEQMIGAGAHSTAFDAPVSSIGVSDPTLSNTNTLSTSPIASQNSSAISITTNVSKNSVSNTTIVEENNNEELLLTLQEMMANQEASELAHQEAIDALMLEMQNCCEETHAQLEQMTSDYNASIAALELQIVQIVELGQMELSALTQTIQSLTTQIADLQNSLQDALTHIAELENLITGSDQIVNGSEITDYIYGGSGNDQLFGMGEKDYITGGAGADYIDGGEGLDDVAEYVTSETGVVVSIQDGAGYAGDAEGDTLVNIEFIHGSMHDDWIEGDAINNRLEGRLGDDELFGLDGNDILLGGYGADLLNGGDGNDTANYNWSDEGVIVDLSTGVGTGGEATGDSFISIEYLSGSDFDDTLIGDDGSNNLWGEDGNDTLIGGAGNDRLFGGEGADHLDGGEGTRDVADYSTAASHIEMDLSTGGTAGEAAGDTYENIEFVYGSQFDDTISGNDEVNRLVGNEGNDTLFGAGGNDYILGNEGNDTLTGGTGADVFIFNDVVGNDTITDFESGMGRTDRIWLQDQSITGFDELMENTQTVGTDLIITLDSGSITLENTNISDIVEDDFIF